MVTIVSDSGFAEGAVAAPVFEAALTPVAIDSGLEVSWPDQDALFYRVWVGNTPTSLQLSADHITGLSAEVPGLNQGETYYVQVTAFFATGRSAATPIIEAVVLFFLATMDTLPS